MSLSKKKGPQCLAKTAKSVTGAAQCTKHAKPGRFLCTEHETRAREGKEVIGFRSGKPILIQPSRAEGGAGVTRETPPLARLPRSGAALEPATTGPLLDRVRADSGSKPDGSKGSLFLTVEVPKMALDGGDNSRRNRHEKAAHIATERELVAWYLNPHKLSLRNLVLSQALTGGRVRVLMVRVSPTGWRTLEDGTVKPPCDPRNMASRLKAVQDEIAATLGVDDGDERFVYYTDKQERGPSALRIEFWEE